MRVALAGLMGLAGRETNFVWATSSGWSRIGRTAGGCTRPSPGSLVDRVCADAPAKSPGALEIRVYEIRSFIASVFRIPDKSGARANDRSRCRS